MTNVKRLVSAVSIVVRDYEEAIAYYCQVLGFVVIEDTPLSPGKRWVLVAPSAICETRLLLAKATTPAQVAAIGNQTGGRVFLFLQTDDFWRDHRRFCEKGVRFIESPREEDYATVAVFEDIYGNRWDLLQLKPS